MANILVADDSISMLQPLEFVLRDAGHNAICVSNGPAVIELLDNQPLDLVILDIDMPGMDGFGVLSTIRDHPVHRSVPVVMLTSAGARANVVRAASLGATRYYLKSSFSVLGLLEQISELLKADGNNPEGGSLPNGMSPQIRISAADEPG